MRIKINLQFQIKPLIKLCDSEVFMNTITLVDAYANYNELLKMQKRHH